MYALAGLAADEVHPTSQSPRLQIRPHAGIELLQSTDALFGLGAVGLFVTVIPAGIVSLRQRLNHYAIAAGEHVQVFVHDPVISSLLGNQPGNLPAYRNEAIIDP